MEHPIHKKLSFQAIKDEFNHTHNMNCPSPFGSDVYIKDAYLMDNGRIEVYSECQSCMKSGFSVIDNNDKYWK